MGTVIPWEYLQLRIAINERHRSITAAYAQVRTSGKIDPATIERCQRSDAMLSRALEEIG